MLFGPIQDGGADGGRLGEKGNLTGLGGNRRETGIDTLTRQQHPHAVGAEQADAVLLAELLQLLPLRRSEVCRQYDGGARSPFTKRFDEGQHPFPPGTDDGEIRGQRQAVDIGIGQHAGNGLAVRADWQDGALELAGEQVSYHHVTRLLRVGRGTDDGD